MDGLKILGSTRLIVQSTSPRHQPSCRRLQHRNRDAKRLRLTQPHTLRPLDDQLRLRLGQCYRGLGVRSMARSSWLLIPSRVVWRFSPLVR
jgi:hypothetical protein